jgi:hypothetical protein
VRAKFSGKINAISYRYLPKSNTNIARFSSSHADSKGRTLQKDEF